MLLLLDRMYVLEILAFSSTSFKFPEVTVCKIWFEFIEGGKEYAHPGFGFCGGLHRLHQHNAGSFVPIACECVQSSNQAHNISRRGQ